MPSHDKRLTTAARARLRETKAIGHPPCWRCGADIDYTAPPGYPLAYDLDELIPREHGGDPLDPDNTIPAHARCNRRAGAATTNAKRQPGNTKIIEQPPIDPKPKQITLW